jgi:two-component system response regulator HydG
MPSHRADDLSTIVRPKSEGDAKALPNFAVVVRSGPDKGKTFHFDHSKPARIFIGTSPACELRVSDPTVSRRHASLELAEDALRITDMLSTNGTHANGIQVMQAYLRGGEEVRVGGSTIVVQRLNEEASPLSQEMRFGKMIGASEEMRRLYPLCARLAAADIPVIIEGETGTGKEVLAEALHDMSPRAQAPFIVFDCTAVPPNLIESALFGHERGSFTGATSARKGVFEDANGGTLLIDEIGELDISLQPKLLRVLERSEVQRVGGNGWTRVDVRVLAATRRDLDREVTAGRFRDDLFFRLSVGRIELPALRNRRGDIPLLARHFWRALGGEDTPMPPGILERFADYAWPGNVRELHNAVMRALALGEVSLAGEGLEKTKDSAAAAQAGSDAVIDGILALELPLPRAREKLVEAFERRYVERVFQRYGGNVVRAAAASGIARRYFQILRARYKDGSGT